jgi:hypothetical protein
MSAWIIAYIDPGAGGMLMQLLLGGVAGVLVVLRLFWDRIRGRRHHGEAASSDAVHRGDPS